MSRHTKATFFQIQAGLFSCLIILILSIPAQAQNKETALHIEKAADDRPYSLTGIAELGFLAVMDHKVQFSRTGTYFDYDKYGGQDVLFPFYRLSLDLALGQKHHVIFLYQPLSLVTRETLDSDLDVDGVVFAGGTPMEFMYKFPFWRLSWLYDFAEKPDREIAFGASFQIRNATIDFRSLDGEQLRSTRDIGPVPVLKTRIHRQWSNGLRLGMEADGFYAPISYINGSDNEVVGAILDASLNAGLRFKESLPYLNLRYLGGGAVGSSTDRKGPGDGYVRNWLHFMTVSIGVEHPLF